MKTLSIVVPVYYNEESLPLLFEKLRDVEQALQEKELALELIFVDDGSGDGSLMELLKIKQQRPATKIIKLARNFGAIHASKTGFRFVTGDCFMILAADLQDPPQLLLQMADRWLAGSKFVICERTQRDDPIFSRFTAFLYYKLLRLMVIKSYPVGGYDMGLMDRVFLPYMQQSAKNINTPLFAYWLGFTPDVLYYERNRRHHGKSRWTFGKKAKFFLDSLLGFSSLPIRMMSLFGIIVSLLSLIYAGWVFVAALAGGRDVPGFATIVILLAFLDGIIFLMMGIIGEYVWRIFDEINNRPESVIDEIY